MTTKDKTKNLIREIQRRLKGEYLFWGFFLLLSGAFLWSALMGSQGLFSYLKLQRSLSQIEEENRKLLERNHDLQREVYGLRNSPTELERIIREEYGYVSEGEKAYLTPEPEPREDRQEP